VNINATSISAVLKPAGLEKSVGIIAGATVKDPNDPARRDDLDIKEFQAFRAKYVSQADSADGALPYGYGAAATMVQVLKQCGDNLSRDNVMKQAANLKGFKAPLLFPGISIDTSPTNYSPIRQMQMIRFNGEMWEQFGVVLTD